MFWRKRHDEILALLSTLNRKMDAMKIDISRLTADVAKQKTVDDGIIALLGTVVATQKDLAKQLADAIAADDPAALQAVQDAINQSADALEASQADITNAVSQNTQAAPPAGTQAGNSAPGSDNASANQSGASQSNG